MPARSLVLLVALLGVILLASCGERTARTHAGSPTVAAAIQVPASEQAPSPLGACIEAKPCPCALPSRAAEVSAVIAVDPAASDVSSPYAAEIAVCHRFLAWAERYRASDAADRAASSAEGTALARERRAALVTVMRGDPRRALALKLPLRDREVMPPAITAHLEQRLAGEGRFTALARLPSAGAGDDQRAVVPVVLIGDQQFERSSYGRRATLITRGTVPVHGIILDGLAAVHEDAVRPLEAGEVMDPRATPANPGLDCPVSGAPGDVVADLAGQPLFLCSGGHIRALNDRFAASEDAESRKATVAHSTWTEGAKTVLYIRARFTDQSDSDLPSEATCTNTVTGMSTFLNQNSYGRLPSFTATVTPVMVLTGTAGSYGTDDRRVRTDALAAARAAGFNPDQFDFDAVRYTGGPGSFLGQAFINRRGVWMKSDSVGVAAHEFGHNLGLWHANFWSTSNGSPIGAGTVDEYGNSFDTMGAASAGANHFNAGAKEWLGWLPTTNIHQPTSNGTFRIYPQDHATLLPTSEKQALRVVKDASRHYVVEFRQRFTSSLWQMNGVTVKWNGPSNGDGEDLLLDTTPGSPDGRNDAAVVIGQTFSDRTAGIHVTPIAVGGTTPASIDVVVNQGPFPGNLAPDVVANGPSTTATGTAITLTATASDPEADVLAYSWDFGDRTVSTTNNATVSKQWSNAGSYVVRCTVSDMKGGLASDSLLVTVGSPSVFTIGGRVLDGVSGVQGVRIHNGQSGSAYCGTISDSDGAYLLGNLAAGSVTLTAISPMHTLTTSFSNPVTVGPDATGMDFAAVRHDEISIAASDASAAENGDTASFRISRPAAGAAARTVNLALSGTATRPGATAADYALTGGSITLTGANAVITIPAGQDAITLVLTATSDVLAEGAETATLTLSENSAYVLLAPTTATATITGAVGPANDLFADRIALSVAPATTTGTNRFATRETGELAHHGATGDASVWWTWTATSAGTCTIDLSGSAFDTVLAVYTGSAVAGLTTIATNDDISSSDQDSRVVFTTTAGTVYQIAVDGFSAGDQGAIALALTMGGASGGGGGGGGGGAISGSGGGGGGGGCGLGSSLAMLGLALAATLLRRRPA